MWKTMPMTMLMVISIAGAAQDRPADTPGQRGGRGPMPSEQARTVDEAPYVVEIAARLYKAGDVATDLAGNGGVEATQRYVWSLGLCDLNTGEQAPGTAAAGWRFSSRVVRRAGDAVTVEIDWQRLWDQGKRTADGPKGTTPVTIRLGSRIELDRVDRGSTKCGSVGIRLEATVVQRFSRYTLFGGRATAAGRGRGGVAAGRGGDVGSAAGGRGGGGVATGRGSGSGGAVGGRGRGATTDPASALQSLRYGLSQLTQYAAELWLVHTPPGATPEEMPADRARVFTRLSGRGSATTAGRGSYERLTLQFSGGRSNYQLVRFSASGSGFLFPAVPITTSRGTVSVIVHGVLSVRLVNGVPEGLIITIGRQVTGVDPATSGAGSTKEIPWPKSGEVLSFELPAAGVDENLLAGHQFSLRLRLPSSGR